MILGGLRMNSHHLFFRIWNADGRGQEGCMMNIFGGKCQVGGCLIAGRCGVVMRTVYTDLKLGPENAIIRNISRVL